MNPWIEAALWVAAIVAVVGYSIKKLTDDGVITDDDDDDGLDW